MQKVELVMAQAIFSTGKINELGGKLNVWADTVGSGARAWRMPVSARAQEARLAPGRWSLKLRRQGTTPL